MAVEKIHSRKAADFSVGQQRLQAWSAVNRFPGTAAGTASAALTAAGFVVDSAADGVDGLAAWNAGGRGKARHTCARATCGATSTRSSSTHRRPSV